MARRQGALFISEYDRLSERRDFAAYKALGAITAAINFCREDDSKSALHILTTAIEQYERTNTELQRLATKGGSDHGNRAAA